MAIQLLSLNSFFQSLAIYKTDMATVNFTKALKRFFPNLEPVNLNGTSVAEIMEEIELQHPGIKSYLLDNSGALREHVNIFIGQEKIKDHLHLSDLVKATDEVFILQALSGG